MRLLSTFIAVPILSLACLAVQDPVRETAPRGVGVNPRNLVRVVDNVIVVENGATLMEVVNTVGPLAKRTILVRGDVVPKLQSTPLNLSEPLRIPLDRAAELLDSIVLPNDLVFMPPIKNDLTWRIADLKSNDRFSIRSAGTQISVGEVEAYANRALCVIVSVPLEHVSAREVAASLRPFYPDNNLDTVTNVGNENALLVTGIGPTVAQIVRLVKTIDKPASPDTQARRRVESDQMMAIVNLTKRVDALEVELKALKEGPAAKPKEGK